jgi:glucose/mannose transport system permease protein
MATTSAIGSSELDAQARGNPARGMSVRYVALALFLAAIAAGLAIVMWGEPALGITKLGPLQAKTLAWVLPSVALIALLFSFNYPRTGATVATIAMIIGILILNGGGFAGLPVEGVPGPLATGNTPGFLLIATIAGIVAVLTLGRVGVFDQKRTNWGLITIAVIVALALLLLHLVAGAPGSVWGDVPSVLLSKSNPILLAYIALCGAGAIVALTSIAAGGDIVRISNMRNGETVRPDWVTRFAAAKIASIPLFLVVLGVFIGGTIWTIVFSFSGSTGFPLLNEWVGWKQYERLLFRTPRWSISVRNLAVYGVFSLTFSFLIGFLLAVFMDQKIRFESAFRTIYLYPFALSFIVTGHVWAWIMNPNLGLQKAIRALGWESFEFGWLGDRNLVIYALVIAGLWQGTGLIMALMLAGLRGIDEEIWKAARVDGIPKWRTYFSIVIPMMRPVLITTLVIAASGVVRVYDLVVALTAGGPGLFSEVPAKYVYDYMFQGNLAQGLAASTIMLLTVGIIIIPWAIVEFGGRRRA